MIVVAGTIVIDPAQPSEPEAAFDRMRVASLAEDGSLSYQAFRDRVDEGTCFIFEKWRNQEDLTLHFRASYMADFGTVLASDGVRSMEGRKYEVSAEGDAP